METESKLRLADVFVTISDPRQAGKVEHDLVELLVVAVNAVLMTMLTFTVVVPAAGVGSRMGASCPKQYLPLAGKFLIEHTLERLLAQKQRRGYE